MAFVQALEIGPDYVKEELGKNNLDVIFQIFSDGPVAPGHENFHGKLGQVKNRRKAKQKQDFLLSRNVFLLDLVLVKTSRTINNECGSTY